MSATIIQTRELTRRFGSLTAVDRLALHVPRGSVYGFLGPNGAGKTTTIRMLLGLIRPDSGEVKLFGEPLQRDRGALLKRLGALVEAPSVYPNLTGRENLEVTRRLTGGDRAQIDRVLGTVHLEDAADRRVRGYSNGMRQRLGLALALMGEPELLILDEPTNGLDPNGIQEMRDLIVRLPKELGVTVFLSSHLLAEVEQVASHISIIHEGSLRFQGTMADLHAQMEEQVVLGVDQPEKARDLLEEAGWTAHKNGGRHRVTVAANGRSDAAMINAQLVGAGVNLFHLSLERPTLEDIFMTLTNDAEGGR
ncbi:MAG: ATP-binding cassette domain-containing protein [Anaerolineae bacterium]|nr:ATP-binding cassette domain-containing protein [Anaerolineae bacterium]